MCLVCASALALVSGCEEQDIQVYTAPKDDKPPIQAAANPAPTPTASGDPSAGGQDPHLNPLDFDIPDGWQDAPAGGMRYASFRFARGEASVDISVVPLGPESGELLPNVNRWLGQLGVQPIDESGLESCVTHLHVGDAHVDVVDLEGDPAAENRQRMLVAIVPKDGRVWFLKAMGPHDLVTEMKPAFDGWVKSLRFNVPIRGTPGSAPAQPASAGRVPSANPNDMTSQPVASASSAGLSWTAPEGWRQDSKPMSPRVASFQIGDDTRKADLAVTTFPGDVGGLVANINRWRNQLELPPIADVGEQPSVPVSVDGRAALLFDITGKQRTLVAVVPADGQTWFFKLTGDADLLGDQKAAFLSFLGSIRFGGGPR